MIRQRGHIVPCDIPVAAHANDALALQIIDEGARAIAEVVAALVNFANLGLVVIGGGVLLTAPTFLRVLSDTVMRRGTVLVTRDLEIRGASLDFLEGVKGAALLAVENLLAPAALTRWVAEGTPLGHAAALPRYATAFN